MWPVVASSDFAWIKAYPMLFWKSNLSPYLVRPGGLPVLLLNVSKCQMKANVQGCVGRWLMQHKCLTRCKWAEQKCLRQEIIAFNLIAVSPGNLKSEHFNGKTISTLFCRQYSIYHDFLDSSAMLGFARYLELDKSLTAFKVVRSTNAAPTAGKMTPSAIACLYPCLVRFCL